ncbi:hypothetical protein A0H81_13142 [Grifola frondosa]|uniref:Uncharacterized protein n=1 Tax=Grifola frondosa TaxID=5627 RepID=A0A1C7LRQ6_GRIFR|nr:hypothetical protein A0H81_13142 [Grifola frondosa]
MRVRRRGRGESRLSGAGRRRYRTLSQLRWRLCIIHLVLCACKRPFNNYRPSKLLLFDTQYILFHPLTDLHPTSTRPPAFVRAIDSKTWFHVIPIQLIAIIPKLGTVEEVKTSVLLA